MSLFIDIRSEYSSNHSLNNNTSSQNAHNSQHMKKISMDDLLLFIKKNLCVVNLDNDFDNCSSESNDDTKTAKKPLNNTNRAEVIIKPLQQNSLQDITILPDFLDGIFNKFYTKLSRYGVLKYNDNQQNISLYTAVLTCIKDNFKVQTLSTQYNYVKQLNTNLVSFVNNKFVDFKYKNYKWNKGDVVEQLKKFSPTKTVMKLLSDHLHLNIFMIDIDNDKLFIVDEISPFKKSIILMLIDGGFFEPVSYNNTQSNTCIEPSIDIIKHFIKIKDDISQMNQYDHENEIELDKYLMVTKESKLSLTDKKILNLMKQNSPIKDETQIDESEQLEQELKPKVSPKTESEVKSEVKSETKLENIHVDVKQNDNLKEFKQKVYNEKTMKLDELQQDAAKLGIPLFVSGKKQTKAQLIESIKSLLSI